MGMSNGAAGGFRAFARSVEPGLIGWSLELSATVAASLPAMLAAVREATAPALAGCGSIA